MSHCAQPVCRVLVVVVVVLVVGLAEVLTLGRG